MSSLTPRSRLSNGSKPIAALVMLAAGAAQAASPDAFTFVERTGITTNVVVTSEAKTLSGFSGTLELSVTQANGAQYSISGAAYTSNPGTIDAGQTLRVRHVSSPDPSTATVTTVTVGDYSTPFRTVTGTADRTPAAFDFGMRLNTQPATFVPSEPLTPSGYNTAVSIAPGGGAQYSFDGLTWSNTAGTLQPNQGVRVRHLTSPALLAYTKTSLTIGGVTGYFTTRNWATPNFPPSANAGADLTADEGASVTLAGSGSDPENAALAYAWTQLAGPAVELQDAATATSRFTAPAVAGAQALSFRLTVTDNAGNAASDEVTVLVADTTTVSIADAAIVEGQAGQSTLTFTVSLSAPQPAPASVQFATQDDSASAGSDYVAAAGTVTFAPGQTQQQVNALVLGDTVAEDDETLVVALTAPVGVAVGDGTATGTIRNDDFPFLVGTGAADHNPIAPICVGGGSTLCGRQVDPRVPGAIRDDLIARAAAITGANGQTFIIVTTTNIGYFLSYKPEQSGYTGIYDVRLRIAQATGVPSTSIVVVSDHSHNGPDTIGIWGGVDESYMRITANSVVNAAIAAFDSRRPASIRVAAVNQNDRPVPGVPRLDSSYSRPPAYDPDHGTPANEFRVLTADGADGRVLTMVNYAPHATVLNGAATDQLSGDWAAWAPQEAEAEFGGFGLAAIGTVGATDWNKFGNNADQKEAEARARLRTLMAAAAAELTTVQGDDVKVDSVFIHEEITQPVLLGNYAPGKPKTGLQEDFDNATVRIDRAPTPPWLTGTVVGTYTSAIRIGDVFMSTFPGEPFGELEWALNGEGGVQGARAQFLFGGANDFFGYMVRYPETYQQTLRAGATWLGGCPEQEFVLDRLGVDYEDSCADHWALMVSPTIGPHIVCTLQDAAARLGFGTGPRAQECPALTALDGIAPPPESGSALQGVPIDPIATAAAAAHELVERCATSGAPASVCAALQDGTREIVSQLPVAPAGDGRAHAGVAIKDASWHLGASAGQFSDNGAGIARDKGFDPYGHSTVKVGSDTLGTRITTRALVVQGANGQRVAIASNDLYLPNDLLHRRTAQLLAEHDALALATGGVVTGITDANLATTSSHSHTSPFYSTPAWGTWIFQDVMDLRFYEYMARQMADAVIEAASTMRPVRMGGATVHANDIQSHTYGPKEVHDGTPAGQPYDYTTQAVTVVHFDDISTGVPKPLANWVIFGVHPEWVWGEEIVNGDITHAVMRMLDRETGATTVWSQRETGASGPHKDERVHAPSARREFQESSFAGYDRAARYLTDSIKRALGQLASGMPERPDQFAPFQQNFVVASVSQRFAPPATRPYPGVSNCNTERALQGEIGAPVIGLPDCSDEVPSEVPGIGGESWTDYIEPFWQQLPVNPADLAQQLNEAGVPIPTSYSASSFTGVQETAAVHLQVFKLGTIAATLSPNEQFTSQALNIESRLDRVPDNLWHGWDWTCQLPAGDPARAGEPAAVAAHCARQSARYPDSRGRKGSFGDEALVARMRAQIHNDARGWELDPVYMNQTRDTSPATTFGSEAEPDDIKQIKGNFTHEEFTANGYDLVVSVGMANDYWGYMAEYREYRAHSDPYRKALNALGPHGADFVATRLSRMAANLNGANVALPFNPFDAPFQAESVRAEAFARTMGELARDYTTAYGATLPPDGGVPGIVEEPELAVKRFSAATLQFIGGSNYTDLPYVRVERLVSGTPADGVWETYGTQDGEVQLQLQFIPNLVSESGFGMPDPAALALWRAGQFEWVWTATFEAFVSELPDIGGRPGITPAGTYRFVVDGQHLGLMGFPNAMPYHLESRNFEVTPWDGITVEDLRVEADGRVSFKVGPVNTFFGRTFGPVDYPDTYTGGLTWVRKERQLKNGAEQYCSRCSFRPWADTAALAGDSIPVTVRRADGSTFAVDATAANGRWVTSAAIADGDSAFVASGAIVDQYGERNGAGSATVTRGYTPPPDGDGDGVADELDQCPAQAGPASNNGCPVTPPADADGDGVPDASDACPTEAGSARYAGCPPGAFDALADQCEDMAPDAVMCLPVRIAADALATRNPWLARRPLNISHRGGAGEFPENTLFAYAKSLEVGSDMIEADVYETRDGELVVIHDATIDRTTNGSGDVSSFTLAQLKAFDAAHCFRPGGSNCSASDPSLYPYRGIALGQKAPPAGFTANDFRIPTLRELLGRFPTTLINLELKPDPDSTGSYEGKMAAILAEFGRTDDVMVASFLDSASAAFKAQAPRVSTSVPTVQVAAAKATGQGPANGVTVGHEAFQVPIEFGGVPVIDQNFIDDAHARGLAVQAWTIDNCNDMVDLLDMGVDGIMTDKPSLLQSVLDARAATADRSQWPCTGTLAGPGPGPAAGGVFGEGILGALGRFLSTLGEALFAALSGDFAGAQTTFTAAIGTLAGDTEEIASGDPGDPAAIVGSSRLLPSGEEGACTPDNASWSAYGHFKGSLHEHSGYSDGAVRKEPRDYYAAGRTQGLDFMGGSEHSDNADAPFAVPDQSCLAVDGWNCLVADNDDPVDAFRKWDATLEQARAASTANFTAFRGFEWTSDRFGHINVFFSRHDWNAKTTEGYAVSMESFWTWFTTRPEAGGGSDGLGVFNHPGREDQLESRAPSFDPAYTFNDFEYQPEADLRMVGVETFGKGSDTYDIMNGAPAGGWYAYALDRGWHVGPVGAEDEHGTSWGQPGRAKTVVIARDRSEGALREALFARRFYSLSQGHNDIRLSFTGDGLPMGSRLAHPAGTEVTLQGAVTAGASVHHVDIVTAGGAVLATAAGTSITATVGATTAERWYYFRAVRADGRPIAYSAPIWLRAGGDYPVCGEWLAGDLHVHSWYSHDSWSGDPDDEPFSDTPEDFYTLGHSVENQFRIAAARGLDYLAISDHNNVLSHSDPGFGAFGVVPVRSYEDSVNGGAHAQMHGAARVYDPPSKSTADVGAMVDGFRADGGVFQINHPFDGEGDYPANAGWKYGYDVQPDAIEVWNIGPRFYQKPFPANTNNDDSTRYWEGWLDRRAATGRKVTATGGSDNHWVATTAVQGNGQPTTWVFATERSEHGVLDGLRAGRTAIAHQPPLLNAPVVVIEADADGDGRYESMTGAVVPKGVALRVRAANAGSALLRIIVSGGSAVIGPIPVVTPVFEYRFTLPAAADWVRAEVAEFDARSQRQELDETCRNTGVLSDNGFPEDTHTTYCRNQLLVLGMSSALYLD